MSVRTWNSSDLPCTNSANDSIDSESRARSSPCQAMGTGTYGCSADQDANLALLPVWECADYS